MMAISNKGQRKKRERIGTDIETEEEEEMNAPMVNCWSSIL